MTNSTISYESCFDSLAGTPNKKRTNSMHGASSSAKRGTPASASNKMRGDRFIPQRSAMDLDVSHFELTRNSNDSENNQNVNASPAKEECKRRRRPKKSPSPPAPAPRRL